MLKYVAALCCLKNGSYYSVMVLNKSPEAFCVIYWENIFLLLDEKEQKSLSYNWDLLQTGCVEHKISFS